MIVLDCSAAVEIVRGTELGNAFKLLMLDGGKVITSDLFLAETRNVFWKYVKAGIINNSDAIALINDTQEMVDEFIPLSANAAESFSEACVQKHSVYDMFYLTLARRNAATLLTADRGLMKLCEKMGLYCVTEIDFEQ